MAKEPITTIDPNEWRKLSPEEKQRFCDELNKTINDRRAAKGLPPLPDSDADE